MKLYSDLLTSGPRFEFRSLSRKGPNLAMVQAVSYGHFFLGARVQFQTSPCASCGRPRALRGFSPSNSVGFLCISILTVINPLKPELNPICYLLALLGAHHFLHVSRIRVKLLTFRLLISYIYIYGAPILDVSRSHTTTQHSR